MGGGRDSSSKRRKSSKRKRENTSSKKKSRRKEPKKRRRSYDLVTAYSDDDSEHSSSSTLKSDYRRRISKNKKRRRDSSLSSYSDYQSLSSDSDSLSKGRRSRRSQVGSKDTKKWARKRPSSPNADVDEQGVRKRNRLDRDHVVKPIKKSLKKKSRKYLSSSSSSDSESCSTCQSSSSSSSAGGKRRRSKVVLNKEIGRRKGRDAYKGKKKRKIRTPSRSSCGTGSDPSVSVSNSDGTLFPTNNSRRLRSVIAVVDQRHDAGENRWEMDPHKEEIVYDQNDYPSPKSLDSNEGGSKMESDKHSHGAFGNTICVENVSGEEVPELGKSRIDEGNQNEPGDRQLEGARFNDSQKDKEIDMSVPDTALGGDVLESILRQKALENLRKFKGRCKTGPRSTTVKMNNDSDVDRSSAGTVDTVQNKSIKQVSSAQEMNQRSGLSLKRDFSLVAEVKKFPDSEHVEKDAGMAKQSDEHPPNVTALLECSEDDERASSHAVLAKPVLGSDTGPGTGGANACSSSNVEPSSSVGPISGEHSLERENEAKDGSQLEQKTMSVMRGGEIVQVSYKVYIPKKAPALARRQLRR